MQDKKEVMKNRILIDWFAFTVHDFNEFDVLDIFNINVNDVLTIKGVQGYRDCFTDGFVKINFNGQSGMGVHVILSGTACKYYSNFFNMIDFIHFIQGLKNIKITRLDIAYDDFEKKLSMNKVRKHINNKSITSLYSKHSIIQNKDFEGNITSDTINFGSRSSEVYMRLYNKALEKNESYHWLRFEIEFKGKKAMYISQNITNENINKIISSIFKKYLQFRDINKNDSNKNRWKISNWYLKFLGTFENIIFYTDKNFQDILSIKLWIEKQVSTSLALVFVSEGGDIDYLKELIKTGQSRFTKKQKIMLDNYYYNN